MKLFTNCFKLSFNKWNLFAKTVFSLLFLFILTPDISAQNDTIFFQDWENGIGSWFASNEVWEVGVPTSGPSSAYSGQQCAATILNGNYPSNVNTRLESPISPQIVLPSIFPSEKILLKFWHWFSNSDDNGSIQISVNGGAWQTINNPLIRGYCGGNWTQYVADLSAFADSSIRLGFLFSSGNFNVASGWYVDDILIVKKIVQFNNPEDFELGIQDWSADRGVWEVGIPSVGPPNAYSGQNCAGTVLNANYPANQSSRLISPEIILPALTSPEKILLKLWHWFLNSDDNGSIQISVNGGTWQTINNPLISGYCGGNWTQYVADLSAFADSSIRLGFLYSSGNFNVASGWYVDDILIVKKIVQFNNPEDFELGIQDWSADRGVWEVGIPSVGPPNAYSGQNCAGTVLNANYPANQSSRLISPAIEVIPLPGQIPILFFWHWFSLSDDAGRLQISVNNGEWQTVAGPFSGSSPVWTQAPPVDLSAYVDSSIRLGFLYSSGNFNVASGWYIDDIRIEGIEDPTSIDENTKLLITYFELAQNYPNPFNPTTKINYQIPETGLVSLKIYDVLGREVSTLVNEEKPAGSYEVEFNGRELTSGIYFYQIKAGEFKLVRKMLILK